MAVLARCIEPASQYVRKVGKVWLVVDRENPSEFLHGPIFKTRKAALEYAGANATAVFKRIRESQQQGETS